MTRLALVLAVVLASWRTAGAHEIVSPGASTRYQPVTCNGIVYEQHWPHAAIPIYLNTSLQFGVQFLKAPNGEFWNLSGVIAQLRIVINEFNTTIGANLRLYYAGTTLDPTVTGGIVVGSDPTPSAALGFASNEPTCVGAFKGQILRARVRLTRFNTGGTNRTFSGFENQVGQLDMVALLNHEIGHALGMSHASKGNGPGPTLLDSGGVEYGPSSRCIMFHATSFGHRHWTRYEKDTLRASYGVRLNSVYAIQSGNARGYGVSWNIPAPTSLSNDILIGPGKATEGASPQRMAWSALTTSGPAMTTPRRLSPNAFSQFASVFTPLGSLTAPAVAFGAGQFRMYWLEGDQPVVLQNGNTAAYGTSATGFSFADKRIQLATSTDGLTWVLQGFLPDPATGQPIRIATDDVSAGFDPVRAVFLVTWVDNNYNAKLLTTPGPGSSQPGNVITNLPIKYWETPQVSCRTAGGCQLVGPIHVPTIPDPINDPYLVTLNGTISAAGAYTVLNTISDTGIRTTSALGVTYSPFDDSFVLAYLGSDGGSLYTRKKFSLTTAWGAAPGPIVSLTRALSPPSVGNWTDTPRGHIGIMTAIYGPL